MPGIARALGRIGVDSLQDLELRRVGTRKSWEGLTRSFAVPMNSDYSPVLDEGAARSLFLQANAKALVVFEKRIFPAVEMLSGLSLAENVTSVTPTPFFVGSRLGLEAIWLRDVLLRRLDASLKFVLSQDLHDHARAVAEWLGNCQGRTLPLRSLLRTAQSMLAELTKNDLEPIWHAVHACEASLSARDREWVGVLEAIGRRDGSEAVFGHGGNAGVACARGRRRRARAVAPRGQVDRVGGRPAAPRAGREERSKLTAPFLA